jgi:hypothetical protein
MTKKVLFSAKPNVQTLPPPTADSWVDSGQVDTAPLKRLTIDVPVTLHRRVKSQCANRGLKMADEIRVLLEKHFPEV